MANTPFTSRGNGDLVIRDGDSVSGDDATGGAGGNLTLEGGSATATSNTDGGDLVLRPGVEDGSGTIGEVQATNRTGTEDDAIIAFSSATGNSHTFRWRTGTVDPNTDLVPATAGGDLYVQSDGTMWIASGAGTGNWTALSTSTGNWSAETTQTTDATADVTIATPVSTVTDGTQHSVEVLISAEAGGANTYFRRQIFTFYRDGGGAVQWTTEINGAEGRRGLTTATASLSVSGNSVLVTATGEAATNINWTVQYRTTNTITSGGMVSTAGIVRETFDNRGSATTTGSAAASGGTVDFTLGAGAAYGTMQFLRVVTATGTCASATVQFFRDAGRTDEIYKAENVDTSTQYSDRNPSTMMGDDGSGLASNTMYGRITNNDAGAATFDIEAVIWGVT